MIPNLLSSYKKLASVFELNWSIIEPLSCCVGASHPIITAAAAAALTEQEKQLKSRKPKSWLFCGEVSRSSSASLISVSDDIVVCMKRKFGDILHKVGIAFFITIARV